MTLLNYKFARYKIQQKDVRDETEKKRETLETYQNSNDDTIDIIKKYR